MSKRFTLARPRASATRVTLAAMATMAGFIGTGVRAADPVAVDAPAVADFRVVHAFSGDDGGSPYTALVPGADGALYGTTWNFGPAGGGTVFRLDAAGALTTFAALGWNNSAGPTGPVLLAPDGNFYGVGDSGSPVLPANLFRVTPTGSVQYLHSFPGNGDLTGSNPSPGLVLGPDGALYGTALGGGTFGAGVVFRVTLAGDYSVRPLAHH